MRHALRFLTVLPTPPSAPADSAPAARSLAAFPLVGALIGLAWYVTAGAGARLWSYFAAVALVLVVDAVLTGGLHLDALADVADGVASRRPADQAIEIMRQPTIGALGAAALLGVTLLRFAWLIMLVPLPALISAPIAGRTAMVVLLWRLPARSEDSLAAAFSGAGRATMLAAVVIAAGLSLATGLLPDASFPLAGLVAVGVAVAFALGFAAWWRRRFGGLVGDAVGACGLLAETAALGALALLPL